MAQIICISFAFFFVACSSNQLQYVDSRDYTSFGLDNHDIDDKVQKIAKSLLNSRATKSQKKKKVLAIGEIDDKTSNGIDTEIIATELIKYLSDSDKFLVVNAGQDKKVEQMIRDARKMRNDAEYNQYTTIEQGNLISPHYALTGKITEQSKIVGEDEIKEYVLAFKLTDLMRGVVRWVGKEQISKKLPKSEVKNLEESKSPVEDKSKERGKSEVKNSQKSKSYDYNSLYSNNHSYTSYTHIYGYTPSYSQDNDSDSWEKEVSQTKSYTYTPSYLQDDDSDSWEDVKEFSSSSVKKRNHFILGVDFGLGGVGINLPPIDFTIIEKTSYSKPTATPHSMWIDDLYAVPFAMPINIRIGYLRDIGENWAFALNFLYNYMYVDSISGYDLETTADTIEVESDSKKLTHTIQRIGGELLVYYKALNWLHIYVGGGALKDFSSKYKLSFEAYRSSYFDYSINTEGQKRFELEQKIDSWYPLVKFGIFWNFSDYIGATSDVTCSWALKEENYLGTNCALVIGLQIKI